MRCRIRNAPDRGWRADLADRFETRGTMRGTLRAFGRRDFYLLAWGTL
ncbi:MAG: hypothetical protein H0T46_16515 [Deltaproteobacteria bacterium]|nr:hypothetical protein [Deltaproteobacteria bacterium]